MWPTNNMPPPINSGRLRGRNVPAGIVVHEWRKHAETLNLFSSFSMESRYTVTAGEEAVWCYGFVRYRDSLGKYYITGFCFI